MALFSATALLSLSSPILAAEADDEDEVLEELVEVRVTGTRIQSPNVTSANPITSIDGEEMRRLGMVNVSDALTQLVPQNISSYMPTMVGDDQAGYGGGGMDTMDRGSYFIGSTIANLRGLDPTFGSRTLTLIDGRRVASTSNQADVVDMNTIPSNLLARMDVVTGGASATYGSGAVAGVVNLVLDTKMTGVNLDFDYGVNGAGDGRSPHIALSGGLPVFGGRGHLLVSGEYQKTAGIRNCAAARSWCRESRTLFTNGSGTQEDLLAANTPFFGYEDMPARFEMANVRYEQRWAEGALYHNDALATSGYHFDSAGVGGTEYAYGFRGGASGSNNGFPSVVNGSGDVITSTQTLLPSNERKVFFSNFEYNINETTTAYFQGRYANTQAENRNQQTTGNYCTRFDSPGQASTFAAAGATLLYTQNANNIVLKDGQPYPGNDRLRDPRLGNATATAALAAQLGFPHAAQTGYSTGNGVGPGGRTFTADDAPWPGVTVGTTEIAKARGISWPWWLPVDMAPNPPTPDFDGWARDPETGRVKATGTWVRVSFTPAGYAPGGTFYNPYHSNDYWLLESITLHEAFDGSPLVLPQVGRNSYAFLNNLSDEALLQVQSAFGRSGSAGAGNAGVQALYGGNPCSGFTAVRKMWNPQIWRQTNSDTDTYSALAGIKGKFGEWKWDAYYQYGSTDSKSVQQNVATNLRMAFALDAVIDDRPGSPTYGTPVCRINRDGPPVLDTQGRPITGPESLAALAAGCKPLNLFGTTYSSQDTFGDTNPAYAGIYYDAAELQRQALEYAFVDSLSSGTVSQQVLALNTNGTLWQGWGAGPLTAAFGVELRENKTDNAGTEGDFYARADLANVWADAFGGRTRVTEAYAEFDMPLLSGMEGINLLALNGAFRYGIYNNKGGAGTTGESATQRTPNWKFSAVYEPFDFMRFRLTRSRDLRAADYRELFLYQPGIPDEFTIRNPWREGTATSTENQNERYGQVRVGNSHLKPEKSDTLTVGIMLQPGGWAQGARLSIDYYDIGVKDGINTPFNLSNPVTSCFQGSNGGLSADAFLDGGTPNPPDMNLAACRELTFAPLYDDAGNPIPGSMDLEDLLTYNSARPTNSLPYSRRGIDFNASYTFRLNRAFESAPGTVTLNLRGTRALESSGIQQSSGTFYGENPNGECGAALDRADPMNYVGNDPSTGRFRSDGIGTYVVNRYQCVDLVGQIRSSVFIPGVAATPRWTGNITASYLLGNFTGAVLMRYIGGAKMDKRWVDDPSEPGYYTVDGAISNATVDNNQVKPYARFDVNLSYNLEVANLKQFRIFGSMSNVFDKSPPFTGGGISGATAGYHDTLGRAFRFGVQTKF